jgi:L-fuculose-phosphate aldolase
MINEFKIKQDICDVGHRLYAKGFAAANDGNISVRIGENEVLCTPTQYSKGDLKPDDLCKVDLAGKQLAGRRKRTSEVLLHMEIYKLDPTIKSVVHCHPPHATAFAISNQAIPTCILPEVEVFLGPIPMTTYETPGGQAFADTITPHVKTSKIAVLRNHGTVAWGEDVMKAYWWTEILDAYCRILLLARQVGPIERISSPKVEELLDLKEKFGMGVDPRRLENADLCVNTEFGRGFAASSCGCKKPAAAPSQGGIQPAGLSPQEIDRLVQQITDRIMQGL